MTRLLTLIATGLWVFPLCAFGGFALAVKLFEKSPQQGGNMDGMAIGLLGIVAGFVSGALGFGIAAFLAGRFVPSEKFLFLQIADGVILSAMAIAAIVYNIKTAPPAPLEYYGREVLLELELRAPTANLKGKSFNDVVSVSFRGGQGADVAHPENMRTEGEFTIYPVTIHLIRVNEWEIRVPLRDETNAAALFSLDLPLRPEKTTEWSGWVESKATEEYEKSKWINLRYRFHLKPRDWYKEGAGG